MTPLDFRALLTKQPFQPFLLKMANGRTHEVLFPRMAFVTQTEIIVGVGEIEDGVPADARIYWLHEVMAVELLGTALAAQPSS